MAWRRFFRDVSIMPEILVVEDDRLIGLLLAEMLEEMDLRVCAIETTQRGAVEAALRLRPDLMLVDARLGRGSGVEAVEEIERHGKVPHIFMSGERLLAGTHGAPMLVKPFTRQQLYGAIERVLQVSA
jgi:DNA-binding response OmpR family regulator